MLTDYFNEELMTKERYTVYTVFISGLWAKYNVRIPYKFYFTYFNFYDFHLLSNDTVCKQCNCEILLLDKILLPVGIYLNA